MEKHLIILTVCTRVEPDVNVVTKALELTRNHKARLWLLDAKGGRRALQGDHVLQMNPGDYTTAARNGLLYIELDATAFPSRGPKWAFSPGLDEGTGLPVVMERYEEAFVKRSYAGDGGGQTALPVKA